MKEATGRDALRRAIRVDILAETEQTKICERKKKGMLGCLLACLLDGRQTLLQYTISRFGWQRRDQYCQRKRAEPEQQASQVGRIVPRKSVAQAK